VAWHRQRIQASGREMEDREERERTRSSGWREEKGSEERKRGERPKFIGALEECPRIYGKDGGKLLGPGCSAWQG